MPIKPQLHAGTFVNQALGAHMTKAIGLAREVLGSTSPNPAVGAVLVKDGVEIGSGFTLPPGKWHAEIGALKQAGEASRGSTLFTTLEPCCTYGRTPPCTKSIINAGVKRVHVAVIDPNPNVSGKGCEELRSAGIEVLVEDGPQEALELYEGFAKHVNTGMPFVSAKFAMSLDGKIATRTGDSKWVTGPDARQHVQEMRRQSDAILVGINTVLADDPLLTVRDVDGRPLPRQPLRVIVDSHCRTPASAQTLSQPGSTLIATVDGAPQGNVAQLEQAGAEVFALPAGPDGRVKMQNLLEELGRRGIVNLLVEGGGVLLGSLFDAGFVDKVHAFIAPVIIGGQDAASPVEGQGIELMTHAWNINRPTLRAIGPDWLVVGYPAQRP